MNKCIFIGNVSKAPELRTTAGGVAVCTFAIAVNRKKTSNNDSPGADFFNVVAWRGLGEICNKYLEMGRKICVVGRMQNRTYDAQDGTKRYITELIAEDVEFLASKDKGGDSQKSSRKGGHWSDRYAESGDHEDDAQEGFEEVEGEDLPF